MLDYTDRDYAHSFQQIGGLEKFIKQHPESFMVDEDVVYVIENHVARAKSGKSDIAVRPIGSDKKSTINLESASEFIFCLFRCSHFRKHGFLL